MYILGLNAGHNATACLLKDGRVVGCVSEERFSRIKNHAGMPIRSVEFLLKDKSISIKDVDLIVMDNNLKKDPYFGEKLLNAYIKKSKKKEILSMWGFNFPRIFKRYLDLKEELWFSGKDTSFVKSNVSATLGFPKNKIEIVNHHLLHAFAPCFNLKKNSLIFTLDGEGDGLCASVNLFDGKNIRVLSRTDKSASLGYLYSIATIFLGMKPLQHEFKVMGLAPYAKKHNVDKIYNKFRSLIWVKDNLEFGSRYNMPFSDHFFAKEMKNVRFDVVAGAVQRLTEELAVEWIRKAVKKTGVKNVALSGGVFMNVKVNQKLIEIPEIDDLFVMPSCGDESNAIGACFYGYKFLCERRKEKFSPKRIESLYLGPEYSDNYVGELIGREDLRRKYLIKKPKNINLEVARLLAKGEIVARCSGKSEWGARALGNRSILANPEHEDTIRILNETIKDRDFWMPFTPSMLDKSMKDYVINQKKIKAPYMVVTFDSTQRARKELPAAMHPYDFTVRPQEVYEKWNPDYYEVLLNFKKLTGKGAVLNTSFNLHGEPNVLTPEDALRTVEGSDLKYLALGKYLLKKK